MACSSTSYTPFCVFWHSIDYDDFDANKLNISQIHILNVLFQGNFFGSLQHLEGSRWYVLHLKSGEEAAEVKGIIGEPVVGYPTAHLANHRHVVVDAGYDKVRQFYPHASVTHGNDGVKDWLQMASINALIDVVRE